MAITIDIDTARPYQVHVGTFLLEQSGPLVRATAGGAKAVIVTDTNVGPLYQMPVKQSLEASGYEVSICTFEAGEAHKRAETYVAILEFVAEHELSRSDVIVALGGGVVGDVAGFVAATYMRGCKFVQIPTSLLAMVDSSVGGKTAIDLAAGKNLAGAFLQPTAVLCDTDCLRSLPAAVFADGAAESIKYGIISDENLFENFESGDVKGNIENIVRRCVEIKSDIVSHDEFDTGERQKLNLGHTLGHAIERCSDFAVSHGHAVAIGTVRACIAAQKLGVCKDDISERVKKVMARNGIPVSTDIPVHELAGVMHRDKKCSSAGINLILPTKIGECILYKTSPDELESIYSL